MKDMDHGDFYGLPTYILSNKHLTLEVLQEAGPRIVRLIPAGSDANLLAEVPHSSLPSPYGPYNLYGGHRLWHAPERAARTYVPDDDGVTVHATPHGARLHRAADPYSHIARTIDITLHEGGPSVHLRHTLRNEGQWPVELAAWAITQLPPQGMAILPQRTAPADEDGLLPNRQLTLWPYTCWSDARLLLDDDFIFVRGRADMPQHFKIGYLNHHRWAAHLGQGYLFRKSTTPRPQQAHPDMGCNTEVYTDDGFLELETLSPLTHLPPGASLHHEETWEVIPAPDVSPQPDAIRDFLNNLPR
jgi:hypothetical protein